MLVLIAYRGDEDAVYAAGDARISVLTVPRGEGVYARCMACAAARRLARGGVRRAVFPPDYPFTEAFARRGITAPPLTPLYRAAAYAIVRRCMEQMGLEPRQSEVMLAAQQASPELRRLAFALCDDVRYVSLAVAQGGEALARELRCERGVAPRFRPDLIVSFDGTGAGEHILRLDETLRVAFDSALPNRLIAAFYGIGALRAEELRVKDVEF